MAAVAHRLTPETDFTSDEHRRNVFLTDRGVDRVEHVFDRGSLYDPPEEERQKPAAEESRDNARQDESDSDKSTCP